MFRENNVNVTEIKNLIKIFDSSFMQAIVTVILR